MIPISSFFLLEAVSFNQSIHYAHAFDGIKSAYLLVKAMLIIGLCRLQTVWSVDSLMGLEWMQFWILVGNLSYLFLENLNMLLCLLDYCQKKKGLLNLGFKD